MGIKKTQNPEKMVENISAQIHREKWDIVLSAVKALTKTLRSEYLSAPTTDDMGREIPKSAEPLKQKTRTRIKKTIDTLRSQVSLDLDLENATTELSQTIEEMEGGKGKSGAESEGVISLLEADIMDEPEKVDESLVREFENLFEKRPENQIVLEVMTGDTEALRKRGYKIKSATLKSLMREVFQTGEGQMDEFEKDRQSAILVLIELGFPISEIGEKGWCQEAVLEKLKDFKGAETKQEIVVPKKTTAAKEGAEKTEAKKIDIKILPFEDKAAVEKYFLRRPILRAMYSGNAIAELNKIGASRLNDSERFNIAHKGELEDAVRKAFAEWVESFSMNPPPARTLDFGVVAQWIVENKVTSVQADQLVHLIEFYIKEKQGEKQDQRIEVDAILEEANELVPTKKEPSAPVVPSDKEKKPRLWERMNKDAQDQYLSLRTSWLTLHHDQLPSEGGKPLEIALRNRHMTMGEVSDMVFKRLKEALLKTTWRDFILANDADSAMEKIPEIENVEEKDLRGFLSEKIEALNVLILSNKPAPGQTYDSQLVTEEATLKIKEGSASKKVSQSDSSFEASYGEREKRESSDKGTSEKLKGFVKRVRTLWNMNFKEFRLEIIGLMRKDVSEEMREKNINYVFRGWEEVKKSAKQHAQKIQEAMASEEMVTIANEIEDLINKKRISVLIRYLRTPDRQERRASEPSVVKAKPSSEPPAKVAMEPKNAPEQNTQPMGIKQKIQSLKRAMEEMPPGPEKQAALWEIAQMIGDAGTPKAPELPPLPPVSKEQTKKTAEKSDAKKIFEILVADHALKALIGELEAVRQMMAKRERIIKFGLTNKGFRDIKDFERTAKRMESNDDPMIRAGSKEELLMEHVAVALEQNPKLVEPWDSKRSPEKVVAHFKKIWTEYLTKIKS